MGVVVVSLVHECSGHVRKARGHPCGPEPLSVRGGRGRCASGFHRPDRHVYGRKKGEERVEKKVEIRLGKAKNV